MFVVGSTCGEAGIPIVIGYIFEAFGPSSFPISIIISTSSIILLYLLTVSVAIGTCSFRNRFYSNSSSTQVVYTSAQSNDDNCEIELIKNVSDSTNETAI